MKGLVMEELGGIIGELEAVYSKAEPKRRSSPGAMAFQAFRAALAICELFKECQSNANSCCMSASINYYPTKVTKISLQSATFKNELTLKCMPIR